MKVLLKDLTTAINCISIIESEDKGSSVLMLELLADDQLAVYGCTAKAAIVQKISAEKKEGDPDGRFGVPLKRFCEIIDTCQPSKGLSVDEIQVSFSENDKGKLARIYVEKYMYIQTRELDEGEELDESNCKKEVQAKFDQAIAWYTPASDKKMAIVNRKNYDEIFEAGDSGDKWGIKELRGMIDKINPEPQRTLYVSPALKCAFAANVSYMPCMPLGLEHSEALSLPHSIARTMRDILAKIDGLHSDVYLKVQDQKFCNLYTQDNTFGLWIMTGTVNETYLKNLESYRELGFTSYQITLFRSALSSVLDATISVKGTDKVEIKFERVDGEYEDEYQMILEGINSAASIRNEYRARCAGVLSETNVEQLKIPISLKTISTLVDNCVSEYIALDVDVSENGQVALRISDIDIVEKGAIESELLTAQGKEVISDVDIQSRLQIRENYLGMKHYTLSEKGD